LEGLRRPSSGEAGLAGDPIQLLPISSGWTGFIGDEDPFLVLNSGQEFPRRSSSLVLRVIELNDVGIVAYNRINTHLTSKIQSIELAKLHNWRVILTSEMVYKIFISNRSSLFTFSDKLIIYFVRNISRLLEYNDNDGKWSAIKIVILEE